MKHGQVEKLEELLKIITVKKDKSTKLALELRKVHQKVQKNKKQMPNLEDVMYSVGKTFIKKNWKKIFFSLSLMYAPCQLSLGAETSTVHSHCFSKSWQIYRYVLGQNGILLVVNNASRISTSNGYSSLRIPEGARFYRRHSSWLVRPNLSSR